jgi:hypothetical protein
VDRGDADYSVVPVPMFPTLYLSLVPAECNGRSVMATTEPKPPDMNGWPYMLIICHSDGVRQEQVFNTSTEQDEFVRGFMAGRKDGKDVERIELWRQPDPPPPALRRIIDSDLKRGGDKK